MTPPHTTTPLAFPVAPITIRLDRETWEYIARCVDDWESENLDVLFARRRPPLRLSTWRTS